MSSLVKKIIHHCQVTDEKGVVNKVDFEKAYDKINWQYLIHILQSRGFGPKWILWISDWLTNSQSCININGELTPFFYCKRGIRQGDPLSPYLYILAADTLSKIFQKGRSVGVIQGLGPPLPNNHYVSNCHYVNDTIIFLKADAINIESAWWILIPFETLFGIKVNYSKTSMYPIHTNQIDDLGLPLHTQQMTHLDWQFMIDKVEKKLQN